METMIVEFADRLFGPEIDETKSIVDPGLFVLQKDESRGHGRDQSTNERDVCTEDFSELGAVVGEFLFRIGPRYAPHKHLVSASSTHVSSRSEQGANVRSGRVGV